MKNQYFGDINDYKKYSLLRRLASNGRVKTAVCWVLTEDDSGNDGKRIKYLYQPETWRRFDPIVFEHLKEYVLEKGIRRVDMVERMAAFRNFSFYNEIIQDDPCLREKYFNRFFEVAEGATLVFFDPDNGLEVKSVPFGKKKSSKYVYWNEVERSYNSGHSILLYQHLPRKPREQYIHDLSQKFKTLVGVRKIFSFCTSHVVFFLIPQPNHERMFAKRGKEVSETWGEIIKFRKHELCFQ